MNKFSVLDQTKIKSHGCLENRTAMMDDMPIANYPQGHMLYFLESISKLVHINTRSGKVVNFWGP
jgi:hypothetical protein